LWHQFTQKVHIMEIIEETGYYRIERVHFAGKSILNAVFVGHEKPADTTGIHFFEEGREFPGAVIYWTL
jgi:hypothetical protein